MKILLVRLRLIGDVVFTTPLLGALRRRYPDAHLAYVVEPAAEPVVRGNPHLDEIIVAPKRRGLARLRDDVVAGAAAAAQALRRRHRSPWRPAQRLADVGERRADANRLRHHGARRGCTRTSCRAQPTSTPRHSVLNQWDLLEPLGIGPGEPAGRPDGDGARSSTRRRSSSGGCARRASTRIRWWSSTSAPATRSAAGPPSRS